MFRLWNSNCRDIQTKFAESTKMEISSIQGKQLGDIWRGRSWRGGGG